MYRITIKGEASTNYPNLDELDGISCPDEFSEYFSDSEQCLIDKNVTSGYMSFKYDDSTNKLFTITTYNSDTILNSKELETLIDYTQGQWSDGIGEGFEQHPCDFSDIPYEGDNGMTTDIYISPWSQTQTITASQEEIK